MYLHPQYPSCTRHIRLQVRDTIRSPYSHRYVPWVSRQPHHHDTERDLEMRTERDTRVILEGNWPSLTHLAGGGGFG